ncbi:hypothetical protein AQF52_7824 [Streptomyces venezuelae]|uniref:hypothetical protein n=1 Tax=Streptomyces gardneri TaxID=66892 RepID=UPI0006BC4B6E|nr:hypothetical protein [Streptomyces gardneri]ALO13410.1 hypothetical protein AQF52_7824 [Streptomyces venezuelae]QPK50046.1 hypothetical protein H4W23_39250 [Streptomyces gardneri]WRK41626.1 hypothetical protein U0M97_39485 [Streptomyces venezuelae]CUM35876.1 hypothetical protein BN2537_717 [Streptomyces venezuelae]
MIRSIRTGRRRLADAASAGHVPAYALHGPAALVPPGSARRGSLGAHPVPGSLGRTLTRRGKALDDDRGHGTDNGADVGDFGGGGGSGGG